MVVIGDQGNPAATAGLAEAQELVVEGNGYYFGDGVEQDFSRAVELYHQAAELGHVTAQSYLGYAYRFGEGVDQDLGEASVWLDKAAQGGDSEAMVNLGQMYEFGEGVSQSFRRAFELYRTGAGLGLAVAQFEMARLYEAGTGAPQDNFKALVWLTISSLSGEADTEEAIDNVGESLSDAQRSEATEMAETCLADSLEACF